MTRKSAKARTAKAKKREARGLPTREEILQFIADHPDKAGKRDIARAFSITGAAKIDLKAMLKEMAEEGLVERRGRKLKRPGDLPPVTVLDVVARDRDGGLLAHPIAHERGGKPPTVAVRTPKRGGAVAGVGTRILARIERNRGEGPDYTARIIKVLEKQRSGELGVIRMAGDEARLVPISKRGDEMVIPEAGLGGARPGDLVEVEPIGGRRYYGLKRGTVRQVVGPSITEQAASMIAIHANGIPHIFPEAATAQAKSAEPIDLKGASASHEDWRDLPLITIDPADAKDHDDAIHGMADPDNDANPGGFIATVAIADVSYYVRPGTPMDSEALLRGNSVYFPDRVVPMLPERISNDLCSLREKEDRPALAVKMRFNANGKKIGHSFHRIVMRSQARLAYTEAQAAIDGAPNRRTSPILDAILKPLWETYACLKRGREKRGPLELDLPERKVLLKKDGTVDRIILPDRLDAHKLVEEFMIQANVAAAETLEAKKQRLIYRVHDQPSLDRLEALSEFLKTMNLSLARSANLRSHHFNAILKAVDETDSEELVNQVVLRSQAQAEYSPENVGHFGLNLQRYAHFTSPIRRYADLIVHRALIAALGLGPGGLADKEEAQLDAIAADISITERRAMIAERETVDRLVAAFLSERIGDRFVGRINGVTKAGLFVTLADTGADGFIPISQISDEYYYFDASNHSLIGDESGLAYQMGMEVEVRLLEAAPLAGALRFEMLTEGREVPGLARSRRKQSRWARPKKGGRPHRGRKRRR